MNWKAGPCPSQRPAPIQPPQAWRPHCLVSQYSSTHYPESCSSHVPSTNLRLGYSGARPTRQQ